MAMLLWPSVLANEGLGQRFCFQTLDERHVAAGEGAGNPRFPSQRVTVPALFFKTRRQLGKCDLCESRCPSTLVTLRRVHIGRRGQREPFALIRKSSGGEKSAFSRGTGPGQQVASRSRHIRPPHETLPPACEDGAGEPPCDAHRPLRTLGSQSWEAVSAPWATADTAGGGGDCPRVTVWHTHVQARTEQRDVHNSVYSSDILAAFSGDSYA